jgi:hypothetical protein
MNFMPKNSNFRHRPSRGLTLIDEGGRTPRGRQGSGGGWLAREAPIEIDNCLYLSFQKIKDCSFCPVEFMVSFLIASSGPETAMNDMQRSASSGTRESGAPSSVVRTRGPHRAAPCGGNRVEGKFSLLQTIEIARNGKIYGVCSDGASMQVEIQTSLEHAAPEVSCRLRRRSLAVAASSTAPVRRKHDPVVALDRGREPGRSRTSAAASAGSRSAGSPMPPPGRCGARRSSRRNRSRPEMAPQRLEKIESAPGNGMGSEASNLQDLVHGRALTVRDSG